MPKLITNFRITPDGMVQLEHLDFSQEIHRGAAFLDSVSPGWEKKIDPALLNVADETMCVCGQVFSGHYEEGVLELEEWIRDSDENDRNVDGYTEAWRYGFSIPESGYDDEQDEHTDTMKDWAVGYLGDVAYNSEGEQNEDALERVVWSTLTEQWLMEIRFRLGYRPVVLEDEPVVLEDEFVENESIRA